MNRLYCTIVTPDYLDRAVALMLSLRAVGEESPFVVLTTGRVHAAISGLEIVTLDKLCNGDALIEGIIAKYVHCPDSLRWSLKSVFIRHLLLSEPGASVLYCDCDCCFFARPDDLFEYLRCGGIVLTPHWRPLDPTKSTKEFRTNFTDGLFNAGCVAANSQGIPALTWWGEACHVACEQNLQEGLFYDQRYLDLMLIYFPDVMICRHRGYNLAYWNCHLREIDIKGNRCVPEKWDIKLVHFTITTIKYIRHGDDSVLASYLNKYEQFLDRASTMVDGAIRDVANLTTPST